MVDIDVVLISVVFVDVEHLDRCPAARKEYRKHISGAVCSHQN